MWYTLVWTDGKGGFQRLHKAAGSRSVRIPVPRGASIVFCAYPLGELEPLGGVFHPLSSNGRLVLTQREGCIAELLQMLSKSLAGPINFLNYPVLFSMLDDTLAMISAPSMAIGWGKTFSTVRFHDDPSIVYLH
jgi:hypothetical protein